MMDNRRRPSAELRRAADPARPTTSSRKSELRIRVLTAAGELIDRVSYRDVTIDAVAGAAGVSKSTLYRHWPSRQVLVLEAYTYKTNLQARVENTGDLAQDLYAHLVALTGCLNDGATASTVASLIGEAIGSEDFALLYRQTLLRDRRQAFQDILARGRERGQIRPDVALPTVIDALYGAVHHRLTSTREAVDTRFLRDLTRIAVYGCGSPTYCGRP